MTFWYRQFPPLKKKNSFKKENEGYFDLETSFHRELCSFHLKEILCQSNFHPKKINDPKP